MSNPELAEHGKTTRFGQPNGPDPVEAQKTSSKPWSIRNSIRRMSAMAFDDFKDMVSRPESLTVAQTIAAVKIQKAIKGEIRAMQQLEESVDGKVTDKIAEAQVTLADLVTGSFEYDNNYAD